MCQRFIHFMVCQQIEPKQMVPSAFRIVSRANYFQKTGGCPKLEAPKQGHVKIFQNNEITGRDSICSKQLKLACQVGCRKKSLEHNDCLHAASVQEQRFKKPPLDNAPSLQNYFQTNC